MKSLGRALAVGVLVVADVFAQHYPIAKGLPEFTEIGSEEYRPLRREARAYFPDECHQRIKDPAVQDSFKVIFDEVRTWFEAHPEADALDVRRETYLAVRRHFHPILFREFPFYCDMGVSGGYSARTPEPNYPAPQPGRVPRALCWKFFREKGLVPDDAFKTYGARGGQLYSYVVGPFTDEVHDLPPFHRVFTEGFSGVRRRVEAALALCPKDDPLGRKELEVALVGIDTVHGIQLAYRNEALKMLPKAKSARECKWLERIADAAARCPWEPPRTFFEGLNTMWFCREVFAYMDGLSCYDLGRPDAWLIGFYEKELAAGTLTKTEVRDLINRTLVYSDCHHDGFIPVDGGMDHEMEISLVLGGCDAKGEPVWNPITEMFLDGHVETDVVFPKLHVRYSSKSPQAYLERIAKMVLGGHCVFAMFNDDTYIDQFVKAGHPIERARDYVGVGCWEAFVDTATNPDDVNYTSAVRPLEASIHFDPEANRAAMVDIEPLDGCTTFEELKTRVYGNYIRYVRTLLSSYLSYGRAYARVSPRPLHSVFLDGCLERRRDQFDGGCDHRPRLMTIGFLPNVIDSLCAIDKVVFRDRFCTLEEFLAAVRANWKGERNAAIRAEVLKAPIWGDDSPQSNGLMKWWIDSVSSEIAGIRDGHNRIYAGCFLYREFLLWGERTRATPDGRFDGDRLTQGFTPSEYRCAAGVTDVFNSIGSLDHTRLLASNANLMFDGEGLTPETLAAVFRVYAKKGGHLLQPNCTDVATLRDAQVHPEHHLDLIVKVCGFSARFVALSKRFQEEVIARHHLKGN